MLKILRYRLYLLTDPTAPVDPAEHDVVLLPVDRMRAERESTKLLTPSQRNRKAHPETWMLLWLWCAAVRAGVTLEDFETFAGHVVDYDELDAAGDVMDPDADPDERDEARADVDPTAADPHTT